MSSISKKEIKDLFVKYVDDAMTAGELSRLNDIIVGGGYAPNDLNEVLEEVFSDPAFVTQSGNSDKKEVFASILSKIEEKEAYKNSRNVIPLPARRWIAVAAAIIVILSVGGIYSILQKRNTINQVAGKEEVKFDAPPGRNVAVLTLGNGKQIELDSARNGTLEKQGNTRLLKQGGALSYNSAGEAGITGTEASHSTYNMLTTPRGGQFQLTLADGTKVWLNAASSIRYPVNFDNRVRKVEVRGEVYMEVAKNPNKPFLVDAGDGMEIRVLGTNFNLNSYKEEKFRRTTLLEGSVEIITDKGNKLLKPGEQAQADKEGSIHVEQVNTAAVVAWKNGLFNFNKSDIRSMMNQLARWYDIDVQYEGAMPEYLYGGEMERDLNLSQVVKILETTGIHVKTKNKTLVLMAK
ncbi:FecR family protein [Flavitalea flava]